MKRSMFKWMSVLAMSTLLMTGCGSGSVKDASNQNSGTDKSHEIQVFAAASLTTYLQDVKSAYESEHSGQKLLINTAGTQVLKTQIDQGAPADLFLAARQKDVDSLKQSGQVESSEKLASNELVVIVSKEGASKIHSLSDLANKGVKLVLGDASSPIGEYSRDVLKKLDDSKQFGDHFEANALGNVLSNESNEQNVLTKVTMGEADAGIVYKSSFQDLGQDKGVTSIEIPESYNLRSDYFLVVLKGASSEGKELAEWLKSEKGHELLKKHGYIL